MGTIRPSFSIDLPGLSVADAVDRLRTLRREASGRYETEWAKTHVLITLRRDLRHTWSPWLHVDVRPDPAGDASSSFVFARFSPKPALWSGFALTYLALGSLVVFGACFAFAQMLLGENAWAWWVVLLSTIGAALLFWAARVGQRLAGEQMTELQAALESALAADTTTDPDR